MSSFGYLYSLFYILPMVIQCQFYFVGSVPVEPMCSKFSYDEQLLEKMVRMEFFVENMKKDVESSVSNVNDEIIDIKGNNSELSIMLSEQQGKIDDLERQTGVFGVTMANKSNVSENTKILTSMKEMVDNIKKDIEGTTSSVNGLKGVTEEINKKCNDGLSDLSESVTRKIGNLENQIKDLKTATQKRKAVAFNVMVAVSYTGENVIKFSNVILNEGNAYNKDTGIFTAPIGGIYLFNAHICCEQEKDVEYFIDVAGKKIVTGEFRVPVGAGDTKCTSFGATALVRKGKHVRVGGMLFSSLSRGIDDLSSFSGTLIHEV